MAAQPPISRITINQQHITEIVTGEGKPILFLHGWGADSSLMLPLAERLIPLGYRAYIPDLPGFGGSDEPQSAWTVFDYANFVLDYLAYHRLKKVYLFGHSFGGRLGLILGADHAHLIHKMGLANAAGVRPKTPLMRQFRLQTYKAVRDGLNSMGASHLSSWLRAKYNARYGSSDFNSVSGIMRETFVKVVNQDLLAYAARVQVSTLLFWGDQDEDTPLWMGQKLEQTIPDAGLVVLAGCGHYSYIQNSVKTTQVIHFFFNQAQ